MNVCTTCNQSVIHTLYAYTGTNPSIIAPRHVIDNEITPNRYNHIWMCNRSLDGDTLQLQNVGRPSDVTQYILALLSPQQFIEQ